MFDLEDQQLDIGALIASCNDVLPDTTRFKNELQRLDELIEMLSAESDNGSPKLERLACYLNTRQGKKTVVFVNAVPTANVIARRLGWNRLVMVTSGQARIASGTLPFIDALQLFAPLANEVTPPPTRLAADVLITTDVVSEGVNLQDADVVVHYDLPWTSLRLQQRIGRINRLGSQFRKITVRWFVPPAAIEQKLGLCTQDSGQATVPTSTWRASI